MELCSSPAARQELWRAPGTWLPRRGLLARLGKEKGLCPGELLQLSAHPVPVNHEALQALPPTAEELRGASSAPGPVSGLGTVKQGLVPVITNIPCAPGRGSCASAPRLSLKQSKCTTTSLQRDFGPAGEAAPGAAARAHPEPCSQAPHVTAEMSPGLGFFFWLFGAPSLSPSLGDRGVPSSGCSTQGIHRAPHRVGRAPGTEPAPGGGRLLPLLPASPTGRAEGLM